MHSGDASGSGRGVAADRGTFIARNWDVFGIWELQKYHIFPIRIQEITMFL